MKERSPPGLVVAWSVNAAFWRLVLGSGQQRSAVAPSLERQSSIPHSFSRSELAKFDETRPCKGGADSDAELEDNSLDLDGNFEELLGNSLAIALDLLKLNWFLCCKMSLETCTVLAAIIMRQWLILAILTALVLLLCIEDFLIVQESTCKTFPQTVPPLNATKPADGKEEGKEAVIDGRVSGLWHKISDLSDSMEPAADLLRLGGFSRKCMVLFKGMEIEMNDTTLSMTALTHIPFFRAPSEVYELQGGISVYNRRDMRKGKFSGYIKAREDGGINFFYRWSEPFAGHCCDEIVLEDGGSSLIITTTLTREKGPSCVYRVVYRRANIPSAPHSPHLLKRIEQMKRQDSSKSLEASGNRGFSRKGTQDAPFEPEQQNDLAPIRTLKAMHLTASGEVRPSLSPTDTSSSETSSAFQPQASNGGYKGTRESMDSALHSANGSSKGRSSRSGRKFGEDLRRTSATFSALNKL